MANAIDPSALSSALEVPGLRLSADGSRIHLGASGLASVTGDLVDLAHAGFTPAWEWEAANGGYEGVALVCVGAAVDPDVKAPYTDPATGLRYAGGAQWLEVPERVQDAALPADTPKAREVTRTVKDAARRYQRNREGKTTLSPELQADVDAGVISYGAAREAQRTADKAESREYAVAKDRANRPKRVTEGSGKVLAPGQADVAKIAEEQEAGGFTIAPATHLFNLAYAGRENAWAGPSGSGKSWLTMEQCRQSLADGGTVLYLDYEDAPESVVARMRALGCLQALREERFILVQPEVSEGEVLGLDEILETWTPRDADGDPGHFDDVILDGVSKALGAAGVDDNNASKYNAWHVSTVTPLVKTGACVSTVDHVGKGANTVGGVEALGTTQKKAQANTVYTVHPLKAPRPGGVGKFSLYLLKDKGGDVVQRTDPKTGFVGTVIVDSTEGVSNVKGVRTVISFKPWDPDTAPAPAMTDLMPEVDAAIHDVFPDGVPTKEKRPTLAETIWITVAAISGTGDYARGLTEAQVQAQVQALAPEVAGHVRPARILKQLGTLVEDGYLRLKGTRYVPGEDREPTRHRVQEVLEATREHLGGREDLEDMAETLAEGEATLEDLVEATPEDGAVD